MGEASEGVDPLVRYPELRERYERLGWALESILQEILRVNNIDYLAISSRAKSPGSFAEKLKRKSYTDPFSEMTDFCGVRIVTYLESDVQRTAELIKATFVEDPANSIDKSDLLAIDRVGYRSLHVVCLLGDDRTQLGEYSHFSGLKFEVQIRTALQHAWAQVEHDRNYKFGGVLPQPLQRRLHLAAGALELIDQEFDRIAESVDKYSSEVTEQLRAGKFEQELNTTSVRSLVQLKLAGVPGLEFRPLQNGSLQETLISELRAFGVDSLSDVEQLLDHNFLRVRRVYPDPAGWTHEVALLRDAMIYSDIHRYFTKAFKGDGMVFDLGFHHALQERYGIEATAEAFKTYDLSVVSDEVWNALGDE